VALKDTLTVMVVDDMSVSRGLLTQALDSIGIKNHSWVKDGEEALKALSAKPVHLVISDYEMPKMNGLQLLGGLRQREATQRIGFILVTGSADPAVINEGRRLGMNNYLQKPFTAASLKTCIEAVVGKL